jgi:hypothetical protein
MNRQINFGDTIFILNARIRLIRDLLVLDADPEFFRERTLSEVEFIDAILETLLGELIENTHLIDRNGHFYDLHETERRFSEAIQELAAGSATVSVSAIPALREKLALLREHSLERQQAIEGRLGADETAIPEPAVSPEELNELLRDF